MTCPSCGAEIADTAKFCGKCGASIAAAPAAVKEWFIFVNNENKGPFDVGEMRRFLAEGGINGTTPAWKEGMDGWVQVGKIAELTAAGGGGAAGEITREQREALKKKSLEMKQKEKQKLTEEKQRIKQEKKKRSFAKAMGYQPTQTARWFESPLLIIICLIPPLTLIGVVLMLKSRHFPTTLKLIVVIVVVFLFLFGFQVISEVTKFTAAGLARDTSVLPSGFSRISYDTIEMGMKREYVYYMLGDDVECVDEAPIGGTLSKCKWQAYDKNNNMNFLYADFQKDVVVEKCFEETVGQKECKSLSESARKFMKTLKKW